jgi:hypothetical protein
MIGLIVRHPPIVVILEVDGSAEDGPIPRHHFIQASRLESDMMQRGFDDGHCGLPIASPSIRVCFPGKLPCGLNALYGDSFHPLLRSANTIRFALRIAANSSARLPEWVEVRHPAPFLQCPLVPRMCCKTFVEMADEA